MQKLAVDAEFTVNKSFVPMHHPELGDQPQLGSSHSWSKADWHAAKKWFEDVVAVYILSLPDEAQRLDGISARLAKLEIPFTAIWGTDLRMEGAMEAAQREGLIPEAFNATLAQLQALNKENDMGRYRNGGIAGTIGCLAGHFHAQAHAAKYPSPLSVIFENDVSPADDFVPRLWSLVTKELPCDWQVVSLASRCAYGKCITPHLTQVQPDQNEPSSRCHHGVNVGFRGMLYRTSEIANLHSAWKPVAFDESRPHCLDVDVALANRSIGHEPVGACFARWLG